MIGIKEADSGRCPEILTVENGSQSAFKAACDGSIMTVPPHAFFGFLSWHLCLSFERHAMDKRNQLSAG